MKRKSNLKRLIKITSVFSLLFGFLTLSLFVGVKPKIQSVDADDPYNVSFSNSSSLTYTNYYDGINGFIPNGYNTRFSCDVFTTITQVVNNGFNYYVPAITLNFTNFQVYDDVNTYTFNIFADVSYNNNSIIFNNMIRENLSSYTDYAPTDIDCDIQIYGFDYTTRPIATNQSFKVCLEVELSTIYDNGLNVGSITYNQDVICYSNYTLTSGVSMGDYLGKANTLISNNPYTWHVLYREFDIPVDNGLSYQEGYQYGYNLGYEKGQLDGYNQGFIDGVNSQQSVIVDSYNNGYASGYDDGVYSQQSLIQSAYDDGYASGYDSAVVQDSTVATIFSGILQISMVPVNFFLAMFNFEILGINISGFISALLSVAITIIVVRMVTGKKDDQ